VGWVICNDVPDIVDNSCNHSVMPHSVLAQAPRKILFLVLSFLGMQGMLTPQSRESRGELT
jgi:hypothetical protein